jgi:hypothetical protein
LTSAPRTSTPLFNKPPKKSTDGHLYNPPSSVALHGGSWATGSPHGSWLFWIGSTIR